MLAHPVRDVRFLWAKPFREPTMRLPPPYDTRGPQPRARSHSVPMDLFSNPVSSQRVYWKNDESSSIEPLFTPLCSLPAAAVRYDQLLASPPFRNFPPTWREVDLCPSDNSGQIVRNFCCRCPLGNVGQVVPYFQQRAFIKKSANLAHLFCDRFSYNVSQLGSHFCFRLRPADPCHHGANIQLRIKLIRSSM